MTTPTREQVVQWAKKSGLDIMPGGLQFDWSERNLLAFATLARADIEAELETERLRLAACGVAALGYFDGCKDEYRSASLDDVLRMRAELESLRKDAAKWKDYSGTR